MKLFVSGLVNVETTVKVRKFPIDYYPVDYPFFGICSQVAGVAFNLAKAFYILGNDVKLFSFIGSDFEGERIIKHLNELNIDTGMLESSLQQTPTSVVLYDEEGKRQIYCDLKDIQERKICLESMKILVDSCDIVIACNTNFNRPLLKYAKEKKKSIATDVHVLHDLYDDYNMDFMNYADILFFSDEQLPCEPKNFLKQIKDKYPCRIIVMGRGKHGALLYDRAQNKIYDFQAANVGPVVNTIGAGDALFSSFLNYYGKGFDPISSLKRAQLFASSKIGANGASVGFVTEAEIEKLYQQYPVFYQEVE